MIGVFASGRLGIEARRTKGAGTKPNKAVKSRRRLPQV
jgi:hypothetical protein